MPLLRYQSGTCVYADKARFLTLGRPERGESALLGSGDRCMASTVTSGWQALLGINPKGTSYQPCAVHFFSRQDFLPVSLHYISETLYFRAKLEYGIAALLLS